MSINNDKFIFLSVIIPVWNREKEILDLIKSIAGQLFDQQSEIIVVDDASSDETVLSVKKLRIIYKNLIIIQLDQHQGAAAARNKGLEVSCGKYVWFIDSDDYVRYGALNLILNELIDKNPDILRFDKQDSKNINQEYNVPIDKNLFISCFDLKREINGLKICLSMGSVWNAVFSRSVIGNIRFDETFAYGEDALFTWAVSLNSRKCVYIHAPLYIYMFTPESLTAYKTVKRFECYMHQIECFIHLITQSDISQRMKSNLYEECYWRVYSHAFGCYGVFEIDKRMWKSWKGVYYRVMILNKKRSFLRRLISRLLFLFLTKYMAYALFRIFVFSRYFKMCY